MVWTKQATILGPPGLPGPAGAPGSSTSLFEYNYATGTAPPPSAGTFRSDSATAATATRVWIHRLDITDADRKPLLRHAAAGADLLVQDVNDAANYAFYRLTADPLDAGQYVEMALAFDRGAGALVGNMRCLVGVLVPGPQGPPGPPGPPGTPLPYTEATAVLTATGFSGTAPSGTAVITQVGKLVTLELPALTGTSNAQTWTLTGLPAAYSVPRPQWLVVLVQDAWLPREGLLHAMGTTLTLYPNASQNSWSASGVKAWQGGVLHYRIP